MFEGACCCACSRRSLAVNSLGERCGAAHCITQPWATFVTETFCGAVDRSWSDAGAAEDVVLDEAAVSGVFIYNGYLIQEHCLFVVRGRKL